MNSYQCSQFAAAPCKSNVVVPPGQAEDSKCSKTAARDGNEELHEAQHSTFSFSVSWTRTFAGSKGGISGLSFIDALASAADKDGTLEEASGGLFPVASVVLGRKLFVRAADEDDAFG